ncbi:SOS response-associated peptidase family protein [Enterococcus sp. 669A]|uniref:Abasic site processing protein n=1 Tax=Candidatus Enterococcus moelleringii TaxID=2815325 RepID=A0ABS3LCS1_9ENTE|nr:SOS response-associated peptidase family protein [Enterococcus sp. 669A]MBO1307430.1 SOS response-associated peptidase family protein [Enterococcus sp. 669A]
MCGRVKLSLQEEEELQEIIKNVEKNGYHYKQDDIFHSEEAAVLVNDGTNKVKARSMVWGFKLPPKKQLLINARSETVLEKPFFAHDFKENRCVFLATGFYEWDSNKQKVLFQNSTGKALYLAGFYKRFDDGNRSIILTTNANESVLAVHERMPLINELVRQTIASKVSSNCSSKRRKSH